MGKFAFHIPAGLPAAWEEAVAGASLANGYDHWPIPSNASRTDGMMTLERKAQESATLAMPFPGDPALRTVTTSTLRPNAGPYHLMIELARGTLNRLRNLSSEFESAGLALVAEDLKTVKGFTAKFGQALSTDSPGERDRLAIEVVEHALRETDRIVDLLIDVRLAKRHAIFGRLPTRFGGVLKESLPTDEAAAYCECFNAVRIVPEWSFIEPMESRYRWSRLDPLVDWAVDRKLAITIGPLIDFDLESIPAWLRTGQGDLPTLAAFMDDCIGGIVDRYRGRVRSWQAFAGLNNSDPFGLGEDDRLRLAARLLESAAEIDPQANWSYALREPYGEYLRDEQNIYPPLIFADTLLRSGHEVTALDLDIGSGDPRDCLDFLQLLDNYEAAIPRLEVELGGNPALERTLVSPALSCRPVEAVWWRNWSIRQASTAPPEGCLYDPAAQKPTALYDEFRSLRGRWLE